MPDYKAMYIKLFQSQTKAIQILQSAQQDTENMYIEAEPPEIRLINPQEDDGDKQPDEPK